jgi:hypothetical protein
MSKGHDRKCDYEYKRLGVCNIFLANEPLAGFRTVKGAMFEKYKA